MPQSIRLIEPPTISPLRKPAGTKKSQIYSDTYIQITPAEPGHKIYFSTDGDEPDPWHRVHNGQERTFKYKGPFRLREGPRIVRALSISRKDRASSRITTKAFQVITNPNQTINEETETDSSTLVSVSSITTESEPQLEHSCPLLPVGQGPKYTESRIYQGPELLEDTDSSTVLSNESEMYDLREATKYEEALGRHSNSADMERYKDIRRVLDANYQNTLYHQGDFDDRMNTGHDPRLHQRGDDLDHYFNNTPRYSDIKQTYDSDGDAEIDNYFRRTYRRSPDLNNWDGPSQVDNEGHPDPPAFWSTQTPRVRFSDDPVQSLLHRSAFDTDEKLDGFKKITEQVPRYDISHPGPNIFESENRYHSDGFQSRRSQSPSRRNHIQDHSPSRHHSPGRDGQKSPLANIGYKAGYNVGTEYMSDPEVNSRNKKQNRYVTGSSSESNSSSENEQSKTSRMSRKEKHFNENRLKSKGMKKTKPEKLAEKQLDHKKKKNKKKEELEDEAKSTCNEGSEIENEKSLLPICIAEKVDNLPSDKEKQGKRVLQTKQGGLNFLNDSGMQINFWGAPPQEVVKKVTQLIPSARIQKSDKEIPPLQSVMQPIQPLPLSDPEMSPELQDETETDTEPVVPVLKTQNQQEQHSIGGFFRKLFKLDDKKKDKKKELPSTIKEASESEFKKILGECLKKHKLWEDPDFKTEDSSIYYNECPVDGDIEWKRPHEICKDPQMFVGGASRFDVKQGVLGNCWLLAAVASLTTNKKLLHQVVPHKQSFDDDYAGIFCFRFWQYGKWIEVLVDDRLPTMDGKLVFMHSEQGNEFWSPLLEKAYAKLCGCYENLSGGLASEAMTDFTGGVTEQFNFQEELPDNMFQIMLKAYERNSLMGCSIDASPDEMEAELDNGLIKGHAYSITAVKVLDTDEGEVQLVRVRNPWGNECEWKGAWSDQSNEWKNIPDDVKESIGIQFDHDGEFWMSFRDFSTHFQRMEICHLSPDSLGSDDGSTKWICKTFPGAWKKNINAGGCRNFPKSYHTNPQYRIQITDADDDDDEDIGTIIVGLMQKGRRKLRAVGGGNLTMGYEIFSTEGVSRKTALDRDFFKSHKPVTTSAYINMREICTRHRLPPGDYCIVLTTYEPNEEADYLLRVFSEKPSDVVEADESTSIVQVQNVSVTQSAPGQAQEAEKQFKKYGGEDEEIEASELQNVLNHVFTKDFKFSGFDINLCRSMIAMSDDDRTGKLTLKEFKVLWNELQKCKNVFKKYDTDKSCNLNSFELREALKHCGYTVSNTTFQSIVLRFSDQDGNVRFDDFVACVIKLRTLYRIFASQTEDNKAVFTLDDFIKDTVYS